MQSPLIIWLLAFLFTFIALLLLDVFSVGSAMAGLGNNLVTGDNARSHFFTGFLAVVVASPCTAPFMAAALGIAFVSSPTVTFLIFNALAVGFALPLTLLFIAKNLRQFLPKPGNWMVTFKYFLAFPMFFTVAWLCWVYAGQQGAVAQFVLLCALITFALLAWLSSKVNRFLAAIFTLFIIVLAILPVLPNTQLLNANSTVKKTHSNESLPFDREQLESLLSEGEVVLVNMTADWCITCKVNEQVALNTETVTEALNQDGVTYMLGDWTNKNDEILAYLKEYERAGVPLYVVYAGQKSKQVLPQMLTPGIVVNALNQAQKELQNEN